MTTDLATMSGVVGSVCLLTVCIVYLWKQRLQVGGAMLSICGVALLGLSWQMASRPSSQEQAVPGLSRQLDQLAAALDGLEGGIARIIENQTRLSAAVAALEKERNAALTSVPAVSRPHAAVPDRAAREPAASAEGASPAVSDVLEIEVIGGVSDDELAAVVAWIEEIRSEHRVAQIFVEPVMPRQSTDPDGQRKRLMSEAGRVMDHVYDQIRQRVEISNLVSEDVPGPRLRLGLSGA